MNISGENAIKTQNEPQSFETLIERLNLIVGKSITELAKSVNVDVPISPLHGKGFVGELLEILLGAAAKNQSIPDFPKLGLELKSLNLHFCVMRHLAISEILLLKTQVSMQK